MVRASVVQILPVLSSSPIVTPHDVVKFLPCLTLKSSRKSKHAMALSSDAEQTSSSSTPGENNPKLPILEFPHVLWRKTIKPLSDFGFGRRSIWEGGIGLFIISGVVLLALSLVWLRGFQLRSKFRKYLALFEFEKAAGICTGTPVRIRGVVVGSVIRVNPSLRNIEAVVEIEDDKVIVPLNSMIEVNQSGLLMEPLIDITPRDPIPVPSVGPLHGDCTSEGLIVCDRQRIKGHQGVSLDELVGIFTRIGREMEKVGVNDMYSLAERVAAVIEEAKPLILKMKAMAEDVQPLLSDVRDSGLLREVESLTKSLTQASDDLRMAHTSVMTPENTELIQKSIYSLIFTLKNIENISSDILGFTGDEVTRKNIKLLIKSLSRML